MTTTATWRMPEWMKARTSITGNQHKASWTSRDVYNQAYRNALSMIRLYNAHARMDAIVAALDGVLLPALDPDTAYAQEQATELLFLADNEVRDALDH